MNIFSIRSPGPVAPQDVHCEGFDMTYTRIANDYCQSNNANGNNTSITGSGSPSISPSSSTILLNNNNHNSHHNTTTITTNTTNNNNIYDPNLHFLDKKVNTSIEKFLSSLTQIGPELLSSSLTLSFLERQHSKQLFGMISTEEKVIFENWIIRIVVNNTPRPLGDDKASVMERKRGKDMAEVMLKECLLKVYECANGGGGGGGGGGMDNSSSSIYGNPNRNNGGLDHIPPSMYEFEIRCSKRADDRENVYSRVANMPALLNLDG